MVSRNRQRGAIVDVLDPKKLEAAAWKVALAAGADPAHRKFMVGVPNYLLRTAKGAAVIGTEGVGSWEQPGGVKVHMSWFASYADFAIPVQDVLAARTGKTEDLADVIREFGDRLEGNFHLWLGQYIGRFE